MDIDELVDHAHDALERGADAEAIPYLRAAVGRAPLRQDLRLLLVEALEGGSDDVAGPQPVPRVRRRRLFDDEPEPQEADTGEFELEEIQGDAEPETSPAVTYRRRGSSVAGRRDGRYTSRARKGPGSPLLITFIAGVTMSAAAAALIWFYLSPGADRREIEEQQDSAAFAEQQDRMLIEMAGQYEDQGQFAMAMEKLLLLTEGPGKEKLLAEAYSRQGDYFTRNQRYNQARAVYEKAIEHAPQNSRYAFDLGWTYYMLGKQQQMRDREAARDHFALAKQHFEFALGLDPSNMRTLDGLARIEIARGNAPAAGEYYRKIIALDSNSSEANTARRKLTEMGLKTE